MCPARLSLRIFARTYVNSWPGCLVSLVLLVCTSATAMEENSNRGEREQHALSPNEEATEPIHDGFLILNGVYVPPPYIVELIDNTLAVNGHAITPRLANELRNGMGGIMASRERGERGRPGSGFHSRAGGQFGGRRRGFGQPSGSPRGNEQLQMLHTYERDLSDNALIIAFDNQFPEVHKSPHAGIILSAMVADGTTGENMAALEDLKYLSKLSPKQWQQIASKFTLTEELDARIATLQEHDADVNAVVRSASESAHWYKLLASPSSQYWITTIAMVLAVVATGNLLMYRPLRQGNWNEKSSGSADGMHMRRIVVILALLGGFDLLLTLAAQKAGGFLELNPLGSQVISDPMMLAGFKLVTMVGSCALLLKLKDYRGAQVASWWLCMICTMLTFRWVTFNSLFFNS